MPTPSRSARYIEQVNAEGRLRLAESYEPELLGSAGTVAANADLADGADEIVIIYADNFSDIDLRPLLAFHRQHGDPFTMLLFRAPNPRPAGSPSWTGRDGSSRSSRSRSGRPATWPTPVSTSSTPPPTARSPRCGRSTWASMSSPSSSAGCGAGSGEDTTSISAPTRPSSAPAARQPRSSPIGPRPAAARTRPAVFLDRDGTLIEHVHYLSDPALVRLLPGAAEALRRLRRAGFACVLVTNQSAIGRGMLTEERLDQIHAEMNRQLAAEGATLDAIYYCPDAPGRRRPDRGRERRPQAGARACCSARPPT